MTIKTTITEARKIDKISFRAVIIDNNWYTKGFNEDYTQLFKKCDKDNLTTKDLYDIASDIKIHSYTDYKIVDIMYILGTITHTTFKITEEIEA